MKHYTPAAVEIWKARGIERQALLDAADDITRVQALDLIEKSGRIKSMTVPPHGKWLGVTFYPPNPRGEAAAKWLRSPEGKAALVRMGLRPLSDD
jgi:hypothetical protein